MARPTNFVRAEVEIDPVMTARHHRGDDFTPLGWAGVVRQAESGSDYAYPAKMVFAEWVVPEVLGVAPDGPDLTVGFWIGLDGWEGEGAQVLQAGVAATVKPGWFTTSVEYWAWTEWYTGEYQTPAVRVSNFPIQPGDTVSFLVIAEGPGSGTAFMRNSRTGLGTSVWIQVPADIVSEGMTAEWAVEGVSEYLPAFSPVTFTNCWGASLIEDASEYFTLQPDGETTEMVGIPAGKTQPGDLTDTSIVSATSAQIKLIALDWF